MLMEAMVEHSERPGGRLVFHPLNAAADLEALCPDWNIPWWRDGRLLSWAVSLLGWKNGDALSRSLPRAHSQSDDGSETVSACWRAPPGDQRWGGGLSPAWAMSSTAIRLWRATERFQIDRMKTRAPTIQ